MPRVNLLIADDVGLGKTIEAGLVVQEMILGHRVRTVLIVCPSYTDEKRQAHRALQQYSTLRLKHAASDGERMAAEFVPKLLIASPGAYFGDLEFTKRLVKRCNEAMERIVSDNPRKFSAMGFVSLPDVQAACRDVEYALDALKLDGINLQTHAGHRYLGHPEDDELYAELDRRRAVVFVHPQRPAVQNMPQYAFPAGYTELTFDTTRAITNMLYTGILAKYPNIRWIMPHMGGVTPFLLFRLSGLDDDPKVRERIPEGVATYLKRLYYDVAQSPSRLCAACAARSRRSLPNSVRNGLSIGPERGKSHA
jgi:predicted TIM-barrel fold metal-dependent hydrolase